MGGILSAEFSIKLPMNTLDYSHIPFPIDQNQETMFKNCKNKIEVIYQCINNRKKSKYKIIKTRLNLLMIVSRQSISDQNMIFLIDSISC